MIVKIQIINKYKLFLNNFEYYSFFLIEKFLFIFFWLINNNFAALI